MQRKRKGGYGNTLIFQDGDCYLLNWSEVASVGAA
jgi:hypothetical protein